MNIKEAGARTVQAFKSLFEDERLLPRLPDDLYRRISEAEGSEFRSTITSVNIELLERGLKPLSPKEYSDAEEVNLWYYERRQRQLNHLLRDFN